MAKRKRTGLGQRLKQSAHASGYTAERLSERLGVSPAAVWAWWAGRNEPAAELLSLYARETGVSLSWLVSGAEEPMGPSGTLTEWRVRFAELVQQGMDPRAAIDTITGGPVDDEAALLTKDERRFLQEGGPAIKETLDRHLGEHWEDLTADQRAAFLNLIEAIATENRRRRPSHSG